MQTVEKLPEVAQKVLLQCKKCDAERYHTTLTHTNSTTAKVQCEVCEGKKSVRLKSAQKKKKSSKKKTQSPADVFSEWKQKVDLDQSQPYSMTKNFDVETPIDHPKFGLGIVTSADSRQIEVVFEDGQRSLVHNRE